MTYRDDLPSALARIDDAERRVGELTAELADVRRRAAASVLEQLPELIFLGIQGAVLGIDRRSGEKRWQHTVPGSGPVTVVFDGNAVYSGSNGEIDRIEARTGQARWRNGMRGLGYGQPAIATATPGFPHADRLFIGLGGSVVALDKDTGQELWKVKLHMSDSSSQNLVLLGDDLYVIDAGELSCLDPGSGARRWRNELKGHGISLAGLAPNDLAQFVVLAQAAKGQGAGMAAIVIGTS